MHGPGVRLGESGKSKLIGTGASFSPVIVDDLRATFAACAAAQFCERSDWNDMSVSADFGLTRLADHGSRSGGLRLDR